MLLRDLLLFVFPSTLQNPLSTARLILLALYGPLHDGNLMGGKGGLRVVTDMELNEMCLQIEKEDVLAVFVKQSSNLSETEQQFILQQADFQAFKLPKGAARLPQLTEYDVELLFRHKIFADEYGNECIHFHDVQKIASDYRSKRILKLKKKENLKTSSRPLPPLQDTTLTLSQSFKHSSENNKIRVLQKNNKLYSLLDVVPAGACPPSNESLSANLKLLRSNARDDILSFQTTDFGGIRRKEESWNETCFIKQSGHGSLAGNCAVYAGQRNSNKGRKYTIY